MSIVLPLETHFHFSVAAAYQVWLAILGTALFSLGLETSFSEVDGAFCPGPFDAVASGRKIAGIAQARDRDSVLVHGTILRQVDPAQYTEVVNAAEAAIGIDRCGGLDASAIASLHELLGTDISAFELAGALCRQRVSMRGDPLLALSARNLKTERMKGFNHGVAAACHFAFRNLSQTATSMPTSSLRAAPR